MHLGRRPTMNRAFPRLSTKAQRGSKPRCHLLTRGTREDVAVRLTALMSGHGTISSTDCWMPDGFDDIREIELHKGVKLLDQAICNELGCWWLPNDRLDERTPNWDVASTCTIEGRCGLLLVEAKAHDNELLKEAAGRSLITREKGDQAARDASHNTIKAAIEEAQAELTAATGLPWGISRDSHYQMSNRFAWAWKVAHLGVPVVLVYLGYLVANEVLGPPSRLGAPFPDAKSWEDLVRDQGSGIVPDEAWGHRLEIDGTPFFPLIAAIRQSLR